jgi:acyl-CoA synthetase (AMP-forming)/AMP-acid ligase II
MRIDERLRASVARHGAHPAVVGGRTCHSYAELDLKSERLAAALQSGGVGRGDRVVLFMDDGWEAVVSIFAVLKAGGALAPVDAGATAGELSERLRKSQAVAVVTQSRLAEMVAGAIASLRSVRLIVLAGGDRARAGSTCISFEATVGRLGHVAALAAAGADTDPALLIDGEAPISHRQLAEDAAAISGDGIELPPLGGRAGLSRLLAAIEAGRTVSPRSLRQDDAKRRFVDMRSAESPFGFSRLFDATVAGSAPVLQR